MKRLSLTRTLIAALVFGAAACSEPTSVLEVTTPMQVPAPLILAPQFSNGAVVGLTSAAAASTPIVCDGTTTVTVTFDAMSPPPSAVPVDVVLVLDESGSINSTEFNQIKQAAITFVRNMDAADGADDGNLSGGQVGVVMFSTNARQITSLTSNESALVGAIFSLSQHVGNTNMFAGLDRARQLLGGGITNDVVLLMTDGLFQGTDPQDLATSMKNGGTTIYSIGMGNDINVDDLQALASSPNHYFEAPTADDLAGIFTEIATGVAGPAATEISYDATVAPGWTLVGADVTPADKGTLNTADGNVHWTAAELRTEQVVITYSLHETSHLGGTRPVHSAATLAFKDHNGADQSIDHGALSVQVNGCNAAPVANAGADQSVNLSGAATLNVTLDGTGSTDDGQPQALTYQWSEGATALGTGATLTVPLGLGTHTITLTVNDGEFPATDEVVITVTDPTPPAITATVTGTLGNQGWYTDNVGVHFAVIDAETPATTSGCDDASVTTDTPGASFTCSATSAGGTSAETVSIKRDATDPVVSFSGALSYTVDQMVSITCAASDNLSGIASSTCANIGGPAYTFSLGANPFGATATDHAGNVGSASASFTVGVTTEGLCSLVKAWTSNAGVANSLCVKLDGAGRANNANARKGQIGAFINAVQAQSGKKIPADKAVLLIALARTL